LENVEKKLTTHNEGGKMNKKIYLVLAIAAAFMLVFSGIGFAQDQGAQGGQGGAPGGQGGQGGGPAWMSATDDMPAAFIAAEDADKDGKVSKDEFGGPDTMFTAMDKNEDGYIELSEGPTSDTVQSLMGSMGQPGGGEGGAPGGQAGGAPGGQAGGAPGGQAGGAPSGN
jgi:hypothetical protein